MLNTAYSFIVANWSTILAAVATVLYVVANFCKRPSGAELTGFAAFFWQTIDRLCVMTADKVPGVAKGLFAPSPKP